MADSTDLIDNFVEVPGDNIYDSVLYDSNKNIIKTFFYNYKKYYKYDQLNRLIECKTDDNANRYQKNQLYI
jgi:hypothetical protein